MSGYPIAAERERVLDVVQTAEIGGYTGSVTDIQALDRAEALGLVERRFRYPAGLLGLSNLALTEAGQLYLEAAQ